MLKRLHLRELEWSPFGAIKQVSNRGPLGDHGTGGGSRVEGWTYCNNPRRS